MLNFFLLLNLAFSAELVYSDISKNEKAPYDGIILTNEALAHLISTNETNLKTCELEKETQLKLQKNDTLLKYQTLEMQCKLEKEMYENLIIIRDEQLKKDKLKDVIQRVAFFSGFVLGSGMTIGIVYSLNQN